MTDKVNILLVDDQPAKLLAYEVILRDLGENLVKTSSAREALDVSAQERRRRRADRRVHAGARRLPAGGDDPRASAVPEDGDHLHLRHPGRQTSTACAATRWARSITCRCRSFPNVLRAKVRVFAELYRKTRELEQLNVELERRVAERTAELEASNARLVESEQGRSLALAAGQMGSWEWEVGSTELKWDEGQYRIFGVDPRRFRGHRGEYSPPRSSGRLADRCEQAVARMSKSASAPSRPSSACFAPNGETRWCTGTAAAERRCDRPGGAHQRRDHRRHRS